MHAYKYLTKQITVTQCPSSLSLSNWLVLIVDAVTFFHLIVPVQQHTARLRRLIIFFAVVIVRFVCVYAFTGKQCWEISANMVSSSPCLNNNNYYHHQVRCLNFLHIPEVIMSLLLLHGDDREMWEMKIVSIIRVFPYLNWYFRMDYLY